MPLAGYTQPCPPCICSAAVNMYSCMYCSPYCTSGTASTLFYCPNACVLPRHLCTASTHAYCLGMCILPVHVCTASYFRTASRLRTAWTRACTPSTREYRMDTCATSSCRYEFVTPGNVRAVMSVAAQRGRVYACTGSAIAGPAWSGVEAALRRSVDSFRVTTTFIRV